MSRLRPVPLATAKAKLSELVDRAERGDEIVISRNGRPVARLAPLPAPPSKRRLGDLAGRVKIVGDLTLPRHVVDSFFPRGSGRA